MVEDLVKSKHVSGKSDQNDKNADTGTPTVAAIHASEVAAPGNTPVSTANKKKRKRKPLSCFEILTIVLGFTGIFVAGATGAAIVWQDIISNSSVTLLRKQLIGEQSGTVKLFVGIANPFAVRIQMANPRGVATVNGTVAIYRHFPDGKELLMLSDTIPRQQLTSVNVFDKSYPVSGFTLTELVELQADTPNQILILKVSYTYDDGFGDVFSYSPCYSYLSHPAVTFPTGTGMLAGGSFADCQTWQISRNVILQAEEYDRQHKKPN